MSTKRYKDGDRLHAGVFNKLLNDVENLEYDVNELKKKKDNNTWRPIKINNKDVLGKEITTPLNLLPGDGVTIEHDNNGNVTIASTGATTYSAGTNIEITGTGNSINALGYVYDATKFSFATGLNTTASGNYSHAEGISSEATNEFSHAEGNGVHATGPASHAEGSTTWANGNNSHAEGIGTIANGWCSHTEGDGTETSDANSCEHAEGRFNASHTGETDAQKTRHSIGIGSDSSHRANAFEVMANGDVYINGVGGYDGTNPVSAQTVAQAIPTKTSDLTNDSGYITGYTLPIASTSGLGGVKIGNGLEIDSTGVVNVVGKQDVLTAGNNIEITSAGTISATNTTYVASDFDVKDLADTTGLREEWSNKQNPIYVSVDDVINFLNNDAI